MAIEIGTVSAPLEPLTFPGWTREIPARDFSLWMHKLAKRVYVQKDEAAGHELLRLCLPGITDEEAQMLTPGNVHWVFAYCAGNLEKITELLKNVAGAGTGTTTPSPPSAPTTSTSTRSPASRASGGRTGGPSRKSRSIARSTPSTA